jgi:hypothetical protein
MARSLRIGLVALALVASFAAGRAVADQPRMETALDHLQAARRELAQATADKGGHRAKALALVDEAIEQVRRGMRFDRRN